MKVKFFIHENVKDLADERSLGRLNYAINMWLKENPKIKVVSSNLTTHESLKVTTLMVHTTVMIFYK